MNHNKTNDNLLPCVRFFVRFQRTVLKQVRRRIRFASQIASNKCRNFRSRFPLHENPMCVSFVSRCNVNHVLAR